MYMIYISTLVVQSELIADFETEDKLNARMKEKSYWGNWIDIVLATAALWVMSCTCSFVSYQFEPERMAHQ